MRYLNTSEMLSEQIDLQNIVTVSVHEPLGFKKVFKDQRRNCSVLCLYNYGRREYTVPGNGIKFDLIGGDIMYVPQYAKYGFHIVDTDGKPFDHLIAIRFSMVDQSGEPVCFGEFPRVLIRDKLSHYFTLFHRIERVGDLRNSVMLLKSLVYALFYEILSELHCAETLKQPYSAIMPAINIMESDSARDIPIPELAKLCGVSETKFRRLFGEYTNGVSPVDYRNRLRIEKAERLMRTELVTVEYAAHEAGFHDLSHFYRMYKKFKDAPPIERQ